MSRAGQRPEPMRRQWRGRRPRPKGECRNRERVPIVNLRVPKGLIADPRAFFAKQFASSNLGLEKSRVAEARAVQT
jgi:hypothetical protein